MMKVKSIFVLAVLAIALWPLRTAMNAQQKPEDLAQKSAESWRALTDSGKHAESWDEASQFFKSGYYIR